MSSQVHFLGSQWLGGPWTPKLPSFFHAPNVADPSFSVEESLLLYPAAFTADFLAKWIYRVKAITVEAEGSWDYIYETNRYEGSFSCSGELDIEDATTERQNIEALQQRWGQDYIGGSSGTPVGTGSATVKNSGGTVIESATFNVCFWCGFFNSTEYGGTMWHTADGTSIRKHFLAGFFSQTTGGGYIVSLARTISTGAAGGTLTFDGVEIPLGSDHVDITATVTPTGFWEYGGTYDPDTGEPA